jgi:Phage tail lysozyme
MPAAPVAGAGGGTAPYRIPASGPVTPREVYQLLIGKGLSTMQAIGVMGNMFAESRLSPESGGTDSNGYWAGGLISWNSADYPNAHQLVTGDPQKDVRAQIDYLFSSTNGLSAGLVGSTPQEVAGNFAANVEKCEGCQPGSNFSNGWAARRGFATMIAGWEASGAWPQSAGSAAGAAGAAGGGTGSGGSACLLSVPLIGCVFTTSKARAIVGGLFVAAGLPVAVVGAVVLTAFAFRKTGAGAAVGRAAEAAGAGVALIPGGEAAGAAVAAAGSAEARRSRARQQQDQQARAGKQRAARERREGRDFDDVMARRGDSRKGAAVRDEPPF